MVVNESMYQLGSVRSAIRELFEYGKKRAAIVGKENVYDFSIGNPSIPAPQIVNDTIKELVTDYDSVALHGYTSAQGDVETRAAIAEFLNNTHGTHFNADNFYMTMGAAASLSICFRALTSDAYDEFITIAPYFPEYKVFVNAAGARLVEVPADTEHFQIDFEALEERINEHTRGVIINSPNNPSGTVYSEETIKKLSDLLEKKSKEIGRPIFIIADEPYREIVYDGIKVPFVTKYYDNTLVCYSYSKSLSLPGEYYRRDDDADRSAKRGTGAGSGIRNRDVLYSGLCRLPAYGHSCGCVRRLVSQRRLQRDGVPRGGSHRPAQGMRRCRPGGAGAHRGNHGDYPRELRRRRDGRHLGLAWSRDGHGDR